jgi:hypothetical protein
VIWVQSFQRQRFFCSSKLPEAGSEGHTDWRPKSIERLYTGVNRPGLEVNLPSMQYRAQKFVNKYLHQLTRLYAITLIKKRTELFLSHSVTFSNLTPIKPSFLYLSILFTILLKIQALRVLMCQRTLLPSPPTLMMEMAGSFETWANIDQITLRPNTEDSFIKQPFSWKHQLLLSSIAGCAHRGPDVHTHH